MDWFSNKVCGGSGIIVTVQSSYCVIQMLQSSLLRSEGGGGQLICEHVKTSRCTGKRLD